MSFNINLGIRYAEVDLGDRPLEGDVILTPTSGKTIVLISASCEFDPNGGVEPNMSIALKDLTNDHELSDFTESNSYATKVVANIPLNGRFLAADAQIALRSDTEWSGSDAGANLKIRIFYMEV